MSINEVIRFKNPTEHTIKLACVGLDDVPPGGEIDVPLALAAAGRSDNGSRAKSPIECAAPQLHPVTETDKAAWKETPAPPTPVSRVVTIAARAPQEAPGVKALREKREALIKAEQEKTAQKAAAEAQEPAAPAPAAKPAQPVAAATAPASNHPNQ